MTCWLPESAWPHEAAAHKGSFGWADIATWELAEGGRGGLHDVNLVRLSPSRTRTPAQSLFCNSHDSLEELDRLASGVVIPAIGLHPVCHSHVSFIASQCLEWAEPLI